MSSDSNKERASEDNGEDGLAGGPEGDAPMSFWEHFTELRSRLTKCVMFISIGFVGSFYFAPEITRFLKAPLEEAWVKANMPGNPDLQALGIQDPLLVDFRVALMGGIFFAVPIIFYQLWMFISPGLYKTEKRFVIPFVVVSALMFGTGSWFAYNYVLPYGYEFMVSYGQERGIKVNPELANYIKGTTRILLAFGAVFQFPLLIAFMAKAGMVTEKTLLRFWRPAILIIFILAAFLTPPEPMTQIMMAGPMCVLFFASVMIAWMINPSSKLPDLGADLEDVDDDDDDEDDGVPPVKRGAKAATSILGHALGVD